MIISLSDSAPADLHFYCTLFWHHAFFIKYQNFGSFPAIWAIPKFKILKFDHPSPLYKISTLKHRNFMEEQEFEFLHCFWRWFFLISLSINKYDGTKLLGVKNWKNIVCLFVRKPFFWKSWGVNLSGRECLKLQFLGKIIKFT